MTLIKWNRPQVGYNTPNMVDLFDNFFKTDFWGDSSAGFMPAVNVSETPEAFEMELSAPGFSKEDIKVSMEKNVLTISGEHKVEERKEEKNYTRKEFSYGSFKRSFTLPEIADAENINASYEKGILKLSISKKESAKVKPVREIKIS